MNFRRLSVHGIFIFALSMFLLSIVLADDQMPEKMATHFNASGIPDGWMPKALYFKTMTIAGLGLSGFVIGICWAIRFFPDSSINLPHRDHWLSPYNRDETFSVLFRWGVRFSSLLLVLFASLHLDIIGANRINPPRLDYSIWITTGIFLLLTVIMIVHLVSRFSRLPKNQA